MKIELKPNWDNAPEWAKYWAVDENGCCWWYENEPKAFRVAWVEKTRREIAYGSCKAWETTLQERPLILTNVARPSTLGDLRDIMTAGIESKLDRIAELLEKLVTND